MKVLEVIVKSVPFFIVCFLLSGCSKVVNWVQESFPQVKSLQTDCNKAEHYTKSVTLYDQLTTVGKFDVLWLSNEVRVLYVDLLATKFGKTDEQKKALLRRQLEENNHFISFYVLSLYEFPLGDTQDGWTLFLSVNDKNYSPLEIKAVDLPSEYLCMFNKKYSRFKIAYSVKFDAKDIEDRSIISSQSSALRLIFSSAKKKIVLEWDLKKYAHDQ